MVGKRVRVHPVARSGRARIPLLICAGIPLVTLLWRTPTAEADIVRGLQKIVAGVLQVPLSTLTGTFSGPPVIGTAMGAIGGAINGVGLVLSGVFEVVAGVVPLAKSAAPFLIPVFL